MLAKLYTRARILVLLGSLLVVILTLTIYYHSWIPSGLRELYPLLARLGAGNSLDNPSSVIRVVKQAEPSQYERLHKIIIFAPYDSTEFGFSMIFTNISLLLHSLVLIIAIIAATVLYELFNTGLYAVRAAAEGSRVSLYTRLVLEQIAFSAAIGAAALLPIIVAPYINAWIGLRGEHPVILVFLSTFIGLLAEIILYIAIGALFAYYGYITEYITLAIVLVIILPIILIKTIIPLIGLRVVRLVFYAIVIVLRPLHAGPAITYYVLKYTSWDSAIASLPRNEPTPLEVPISLMSLIISIAVTIVIIAYTRRLLDRKGVP